MRDSDGDGKNDACRAPAARPPAMHTYQGFLYVPKIDRYWMLGTVAYCSDGMGPAPARAYAPSSPTWPALPEHHTHARLPRAVAAPRSGPVHVPTGPHSGCTGDYPPTRPS